MSFKDEGDNNEIIDIQNEEIVDYNKYIDDLKNRVITMKDIPKQARTYELCLEAVKICGFWLKFVPEEKKTEELCIEAIKSSIVGIHYIPEILCTNEFYMKILEINPCIFEYIPKNMVTTKMIEEAIKRDGMILRYIEERKKTKEICQIALENNPMALKYVPEKLKDKKLCLEQLEKDIRTFAYILSNLKSKDMCIEILKKLEKMKRNKELNQSEINEIVNSFPKIMHQDKAVIKLERAVGARKFKNKSYDSKEMMFVTVESKSYHEEYEVCKFKRFEKFYEYIEKNLIGANLYDYNFKGIDLHDFNIEGALIKSEILIEQNLYDDSYYFNNVEKYSKEINEYNNKEESVITNPNISIHSIDNPELFNNNSRKIYYVSDIHLYHKILKRFPKYATKEEIYIYIKNIVENMVNTASDKKSNDYLLIGGDTSTKFEFSEIFYTILAKKWESNHIIVILGNHEIWNMNNELGCCSLNDIIEKYRTLFNKLNITFLQNELLFGIQDGFLTKFVRLSENDILNYSVEELRKISLQSRLIVLGGLGFSGLNKVHNATIGLYRDTITTIGDDKKETERFSRIYDKVSKAFYNDKVIIFTHTPKENWNEEVYNSNWIYVNGHTHRNSYLCSDEKVVYADNQIGYYNTSIGLKYFELANKFDYFKYYTDGIYIISRDQYLIFNRGINVRIEFNVIDGKIYMLKNHKIYCFIYENKSGKKYLLKGGQRLTLKVQDIEHYYKRMKYFSEIISGAFSRYNSCIKAISNEVKSFGGNGTIHGCIVDIDFLNHLYVNPYDGTISPYFAFSVVDKIYYSDIKSLLLDRRKDLYDNYIKILKEKNNNVKLLSGKKESSKEITISTYLTDTFMYSPSNKMKTIQYLTEMNVIRFWDDGIIDEHISRNSIDNNQIDGKEKQYLI